jgi:hypothetical protein
VLPCCPLTRAIAKNGASFCAAVVSAGCAIIHQ